MASRALAAGRRREQAAPLQVEDVWALEALVASGAEPDELRYAAGLLLFTVYARPRASEAARPRGPLLFDAVRKAAGRVKQELLELSVAHTKKATGKRQKLELPLVAPPRGVTADAAAPLWGVAWYNLRLARGGGGETEGPHNGRRRAPSTADGFAVLLRRVLEHTSVVTSHSVKATTLSWVAKAGIPMPARRPFGAHC